MPKITTTKAAEILGVTVRRVQALVKDRRLKVERIGRNILLTPAQVESLKDRKDGRPPKR